MAVYSCRFLCFILAIWIAVGMSISGQIAAAQSCNTDLTDLVSKCQRFVIKTGPKFSPSPSCCAVVKNVDVACVCDLITKEIEDMIDMDKMVYVARSCGKKISAGTKCGSYIVPTA
ncbi:non-specific lipid-transfer protein 3 [Ricinus communis]|uniref:non-specific lipid-transfer protein 3 n=1 Tax=Ricinus communis TaxID=3988 RepID=UPI000772966E|nr:non-specific lipid-transfer protein 3 [Ricinus communis]|eukprot:XP_015571197.1 non-specific lipid-transfer protein 3 [Ricinus communis]